MLNGLCAAAMNTLPDELWGKIFSFVPLQQMVRSERVSKTWRMRMPYFVCNKMQFFCETFWSRFLLKHHWDSYLLEILNKVRFSLEVVELDIQLFLADGFFETLLSVLRPSRHPNLAAFCDVFGKARCLKLHSFKFCDDKLITTMTTKLFPVDLSQLSSLSNQLRCLQLNWNMQASNRTAWLALIQQVLRLQAGRINDSSTRDAVLPLIAPQLTSLTIDVGDNDALPTFDAQLLHESARRSPCIEHLQINAPAPHLIAFCRSMVVEYPRLQSLALIDGYEELGNTIDWDQMLLDVSRICRELSTLVLIGNGFVRNRPSIAKFSKLKSLVLHQCQLSDFAFSTICKTCSNLQILSILPLSGDITINDISAIAQLVHLKQFCLKSPETTTLLNALEIIETSGIGLTLKLPIVNEWPIELETLVLSFCKVDVDQLFSLSFSCRKLHRLHIHSFQGEPFADWLETAKELRSITVGWFIGELPMSLASAIAKHRRLCKVKLENSILPFRCAVALVEARRDILQASSLPWLQVEFGRLQGIIDNEFIKSAKLSPVRSLFEWISAQKNQPVLVADIDFNDYCVEYLRMRAKSQAMLDLQPFGQSLKDESENDDIANLLLLSTFS